MTALVRIVWKEYRMLRWFWLALAICGVLIQLLLNELVRDMSELRNALLSCAIVFTYCFALGSTATIFAVENEEGTRAFLQFLPLRSSRLITGKLALAFLGTALMLLALASVALAWRRVSWVTPGDESGIGAWIVAAVVMLLFMMGWGLFFSLVSGRPLLAAVMAIGATIASIFAIAWTTALVLTWFTGRPVAGGEWFVVAAVATAVLWCVDLRIGGRWLLGRAALRARERPEVQPVLRRFVWQEMRQSYRLLAAVVGLVFLCFGICVPPLFMRGVPEILSAVVVQEIVCGGLAFALLGACTFHGDQERSQFRFFSERGISARRLWRGRQVFWGGIALAIAVLLFVEQRILTATALAHERLDSVESHRLEVPLSWFALKWGSDTSWQIAWDSRAAGHILWVLLAFGAGQLCSMFFRSGILAAVFGVLLAGALLAWAALMQLLQIGWWWSVAPLAIALFAATWLRSSGWILERRGIRAWLVPAAVLLIPLLALLAAVPCYRVCEIPDPIAELAPVAWKSETNEDVLLVVKSFERFPVMANSLPGLNNPNNFDLSIPDRPRLKENEAVLDSVIGTLDRLRPDDSVFDVPGRLPTNWGEVTALMLRYGQQAEGAGELDLAWERYRAVLNLSASVRRHGSSGTGILGGEIERPALAQLVRWSGQKGQSAERLAMARALLLQLELREQALADIVRRDYQEYLAQLDDVRAHPQHGDPLAELAARWAPWEFARARRLLRFAFSASLVEVQDADAALAGRAAPAGHYFSRRVESGEAELLRQTSLLPPLTSPVELIEQRRLTVACRHATQLVFAAQSWRLAKGELPSSIAQLEKKYFMKPLLDPFTNQPFEWLEWGVKGFVRADNMAGLRPGTPFIYCRANHVNRSEHIELIINRLRRNGPNDPRDKMMERPAFAAGMPGMAAAAAAGPMPMIAAGPSAAGQGPIPDATLESDLVVDESVEYLHGLIFPIFSPARD